MSESTSEAESTAGFIEDVVGEQQEQEVAAGVAEVEDAGQPGEETPGPERVDSHATAAEDGPVAAAAADSDGNQETDAGEAVAQEAEAPVPQEGAHEEASSTAWRSFTAAERRRREARQ
ncbi:MAG: hypothetical protein ACKO6B_11835 [Planctomycetia bacterium]